MRDSLHRFPRAARLCLQAVLLAFVAACAAGVPPVTPDETPVKAAGAPVSAETASAPAPAAAAAPETIPAPAYSETGTAGWYGREYDGRTLPAGGVFDMNSNVAAHRTLPLGTTVLITNLDTSRTTKAIIIDRGPFVRNRIIDLSLGAAREIGLVAQGTARVRIEAQTPANDAGPFTVQAALYTEEENARLLKERLSVRFEHVSIVPLETNVTKLYRVRVGTYATLEKAEQVASKLRLEGLEPYVIRKD